MPVLRDRRHEDFAQRLAAFEPRIEAYAAAGFKASKSNSRRLANQKDVQARVRELVQRAAELGDISRAKILVELDRIGHANTADFFEVSGSGKDRKLVVKDITKLPRSLTAALSAIEVDKHGAVKIKLHDKNQALDKLGRNLGLWEGDLKQIDVQVTVADLVSPDYAAKRAKQIGAAQVEAENVEGER